MKILLVYSAILTYGFNKKYKILYNIWYKKEKIKYLAQITPDSYVRIILQGNNFRITKNWRTF